MKYCPNCGKQVDPKAVFCPYCGVSLPSSSSSSTPATTTDDTGSAWWGVLGFFIPVAGLVLYIVWHNSEPKNAKSAGIGALIQVGVQVCVWIAFFAFCFFIGLAAGLSD
ncbi:zinc-ribbon domain-containing protein [Limosilactobacillus fermentum]|uniref:zinc ribbon domain-containing protein n=1 Tax=Limosilactobacillus fermentum TaxID=1613 RepID=UPI002454524D|nr:zinc ribbon domain-containing protein [Limosilactobacillus fermentum]MDH5017272.1 zinc ribbon domain-containing protein [Limosilactobacillus fermentum]